MTRTFVLLALAVISAACTTQPQSDTQIPIAGPPEFNLATDLLLAHYDCKTDVDDLHSVAAFATILSQPQYQGLRHHAVAGTYGMQEGLYVPPNPVFAAAFGDNWSDAHADPDQALEAVLAIALETLAQGGSIWVAEGGQSDFTARLAQAITAADPASPARERFHVVQHADWNEEVTTPESLQWLKEHTDYRKIPDGNGGGNGSPQFRTEEIIPWSELIDDPALREVWDLAVTTGNRYNGVDGRYLNSAIAAGGLDFSDTAEISWILGMPQDMGAREFFATLGAR